MAVGAVVLLALFPPFFLKSLEFRNDNLWTALWMLALVALMQRRMVVAGVLLGAAFAVSLKTGVLVVALVVAAVIAMGWRGVRAHSRAPLQALAGFVLVPAALAIFFVAVGAWDELVFCNFTFNGNFARTRPHLWIGRALFPFLFGAVLWLAWRFRETQNRWRYFFAVVVGVFTVTLVGFWPLISPRDFLPMMPLAAMFVAGDADAFRESAARVRHRRRRMHRGALLLRRSLREQHRLAHHDDESGAAALASRRAVSSTTRARRSIGADRSISRSRSPRAR